MGDDRGDRSERPAHRVTISKPYAIGKYEVTLAQWNACVQAEACKAITSAAGLPDKSPAKDLSWTDAQRYVQWLSKLTGQNYRLPTEAEWEYAARAGTGSRYWWGETMQAGKANCKGCGGDWSNDMPANVDAFPANPYGLYGMNGGVWEWVEDCWYKSYAGAPTDGSAWTRSDCRENVIRGGSWRNDSTYAHSASRFTYDMQVRYLLNGLRVAKTLP
jgi:formylglycine-generating enzyme required for sulfatase activity